MPTMLSANFTLDEMVFSQTAARLGIDNVPNENQIAALKALCTNVLEPLRARLGQPITVSSGFRAPALNRALNGAYDSQHLSGQAADIQCFSMSTDTLFKAALEFELPFDQLIYEGGTQAVWVHVSFDPILSRGNVLRATFPPAGGVQYAALTRAQALGLLA